MQLPDETEKVGDGLAGDGGGVRPRRIPNQPMGETKTRPTTTGQTMTKQEDAFTSTRTSDGTLLEGRHSDPVQVTAGVRGHRR